MAGWSISAEALQDQTGEIATLQYRDDGEGADAVDGDGIHSARFTLDGDTAPVPGTAQNVLLKVRAEPAAGEVRNASGGFLYSNPGAALTGQFRQAAVDGALLILAEAEILVEGRYHLAGTLSDLSGRALATAQSAAVQTPGTQAQPEQAAEWQGRYGVLVPDAYTRAPSMRRRVPSLSSK